MDFSGYLDVLVAGAGVLLLLSILSEAGVELLKSAADRKILGRYPDSLQPHHIGQRFWHAAVGTVINQTCQFLATEYEKSLPIPSASAAKDIATGLKNVLAAAPPQEKDGAASPLKSKWGLPAEGLANVKEEQLAGTLTAWLRSKAASTPESLAKFDAFWPTAEPLLRSFIASRYQLMRKAYQNRMRLYSLVGSLVGSLLLFTSGQFSLYSYLNNLTRDPAARKAAAAWFSDQKNTDEFRSRLDEVAKSLGQAALAVEAQAKAVGSLVPGGPGGSEGRLTSTTKALEEVRTAAGSLADRSADLLAAIPPRTLGGLAEPRWSAAPRWAIGFLYAWLDILLMTLLLSFGSENWHDILNAMLSVRRQFGGGAAK